MTTSDTFARTPQARKRFGFPDPPEDPEDQMTNFHQMAEAGSLHHLKQHLGNPETTLVAGEKYLALTPTGNLVGVRYPDLLVAFGVDPAAYYASNAYVIVEQGKPPDFVLEVASRSSGRLDAVDKRRDYAALLIPEYWRFDETGRFHGVKLAGDRLVDGEYVAIEVEELSDGSVQGYSGALNLNLRWEPAPFPPYRYGPARGLPRGLLVWHDPATGLPVASFESERERAAAAEARADAAETRVRELEERLLNQSPGWSE